MIDQLKQRMGTRLTAQQYDAIVSYIAAFSRNTIASAGRASIVLDLEYTMAEEVLNALTAIGTLLSEHAIRCPKCGLLLKTINAADVTDDFRKEMFCYGCENDIEADVSDIEVIYRLQPEMGGDSTIVGDCPMVAADKIGQNIQAQKQRIFNLTDRRRAMSNEISSIEKNLPQLQRDYDDVLTVENFRRDI